MGVIKKVCAHIFLPQSAFCLLNITKIYRGKSDGYAAKERELKQHIMAPLISYFSDARAELGITAKQIAEATGKKNMVSHWFGASQWQLPNEADYRKLQALFSRIAAEKFQEQQLEQPHHQLVASYDSLNRKYSELLDEFKSLRRYFSVSVSVPYTDVWMHKPVQFYRVNIRVRNRRICSGK